MSQLGLQIIIVVAFGALCFGCGYLTAFIDTQQMARRNDQAQDRSIQLAVGQMGMGRAAERHEILMPPAASRRLVDRIIRQPLAADAPRAFRRRCLFVKAANPDRID